MLGLYTNQNQQHRPGKNDRRGTAVDSSMFDGALPLLGHKERNNLPSFPIESNRHELKGNKYTYRATVLNTAIIIVLNDKIHYYIINQQASCLSIQEVP